MQKMYTVAIIGVGARGGDVYGSLLVENKSDLFKIVSICDLRQERLDRFGEYFGVPESARFQDEETFFAEKRADLLIVATPDKCHVRHCLKGFELGYNIMTEKPLTDNKEECEALLAAQKKAGTKALVCHVLRYAPAFVKAAELIQQGAIGQLVVIDALERVGFMHQAHSYVRGNWRNLEVSAPMILAKCCHDLDLLQFYANSKCKSISSIGDLVYFKKENEPAGATDRCIDCPHKDSCPYSAKMHYFDGWGWHGKPEDRWPWNIVAEAPISEEKLLTALKEGPYGRCVYRCDNDVVDHQVTTMTFENGVKANLTMTAFTAVGGRRYTFHGTLGDLVLDEAANTLTLHRYGKEPEVSTLSDLNEKGYGHGGGDGKLIDQLYDILSGTASTATSFEASVESHLMGIYAEESRVKGGELIYLHK